MRLEERVALITGASQGIGAEIARSFAREGATCILTARREEQLAVVAAQIEAAGTGRAIVMPADLSHAASAEHLARAIGAQCGRLDIVVGNAGANAPIAAIGEQTDADWAWVFEINVAANFRLIRAMDPLLRGSDAPRALFLTSGATRKLSAGWAPYCASKAALEALVMVYAAECASTGIQVNLISPGPTRTDMRSRAYPGEDPLSLPAPHEVMEPFIALCAPPCAVRGQRIDARQWAG